jgi:hypothetical protein
MGLISGTLMAPINAATGAIGGALNPGRWGKWALIGGAVAAACVLAPVTAGGSLAVLGTLGSYAGITGMAMGLGTGTLAAVGGGAAIGAVAGAGLGALKGGTEKVENGLS